MNNDTNNLVNDLLSILQPDVPAEKTEKKAKAPKVEKEDKIASEKKETAKPLSKKPVEEGFLAGIDETMKSTQFAKVVIRKDLYEVFMSIKRAKQVKSVSTLLDHALEDYIKRNSQNIKQLLTENTKNSLF